jgi:hypothetical protein
MDKGASITVGEAVSAHGTKNSHAGAASRSTSVAAVSICAVLCVFNYYNRLALHVNDVYSAPQSYSGIQLSLGMVIFAYQIC